MDAKSPATDVSSPDADSLRRPVILIVDDQPTNRALIRAYLRDEYETCEAMEAASALEILKRRPIDLVLLDIMMPHMSGFAACRVMKQMSEEQEQYLPVILLTALGQQEDRNTGLAAGADDFLTKPVNRDELLMRVRTFCKLRQQDTRIRRQLADLRQRDQLIHHQLEELRAVDSLKDELVSLMVHDLRNPLGGITGFLETLPMELDDPQLRAEAHMAMDASERLRDTIDDILQVRLLERGTVRIHREFIDVDTLVKEAIGAVRAAARARQVDIAPICGVSDLRVEADRKLVRRAIENLLSNAVKHSPAGGDISTAVRSDGDSVEIEVADRGRPIPVEMRDHLFEKAGAFEPVQGGARYGVGLGLHLVKLVADAHGGRTVVRDREGGGTTFGLVLPRQAHLS